MPSSQASSPPRLYLIDGYSNIFRAFYAIRSLSSSTGEPTNAIYGFVTMLRKLLREDDPEYVGVALDVSAPTVRTERYEEYKANRRPMPEDLRPQIPKIRQVLEAYRIPVLQLERYEADDVLGTLARKGAEAGFQVVLVSADKDLMQLVGERVSLYHTGRDKLYDPAGVAEDFGVPPEQVVDVLALMGDSVDNVPGVPGIGEKGAKGLIAEHGSLEALLERAGEIKRKSYREGLEQHRDQALLSKELVTIHTDLPIELSPEALRREEPDAGALAELFGELEFFSLRDELARDAAVTEELPAGEEATDPEAWRRATGELPAAIAVAVLGEPPSLVAVGPAEPGERIVYADLRRDGLREAVLGSLGEWIDDPARELVGHDLKEVLRLAGGGRGACAARLFDLMLASYLVRPALHGHSFEEMVLERTSRNALTAADAGWDKHGEPAVGDGRLAAFAGERIELARRLAETARTELAAVPADPAAADPAIGPAAAEGTLEWIYHEVEAPLVPVLVAMEERGVLLDREFLAEMSEELGGEMSGLEREIYAVAGEEFNLNSPAQLGVILFEKLGYPVLKRTRKTKSYSTGAEVLEELAARGYPLPALLLRYRELSKLKSTYVDALPALVGDDGRLHTRFNQAVAATGRLSSANPNLQNIPIRTELGQRIRRAFVAPEGKVVLAADYSQIELRILAHIAQEPALLEAFRRGEDIHAATAAAVLGVAPELVSPDQRRAAKTINFGIIYGMSAFGLAANLGIGRAEAQQFIDRYLERYAGVKRYMDETLAAVEAEGKVATLYGRVRHLPDIASRNRNLRENAKRMAINARIQGTAADLLKIAMVRVHCRLAAEHPEAHLLLTVHDELVLEVPEAEAEAVAALLREEMESVATLDAPLVVDAAWGPSWYEAKG